MDLTELKGPAGSTVDNPGDPGTLIFENDRVRVWELVLGPGESCEWHRHEDDHLLIVVDGGGVRGIHKDGRVNEFEVDDNRILFQAAKPGDAEIAMNTSKDRVLRELIIDLKEPSSAQTESAAFSFFATA
jgi:beta-alanine degradation protein BauB